MPFPTPIDSRLVPCWRDPQMFGLSLLVCLIDAYGVESLNWDPRTIEMDIRDDYGVEVPDASFDRLMTAISLATSNSFFVSPTDFARACVSLSGHSISQDILHLPDCQDIAWGITEALLIHPPDENNENPFVPEITALIGICLDDEGILVPPDVLRIATRDRDLASDARHGFSDDEEMYQAIWETEKAKTDTINHLVQGRLRALLKQLHSLPVADGKATELAAKLLKNLPGDQDIPLSV